MFKYTKITLVLSFFTLGLASCLKPESFPNEPSIEFVDFTALDTSSYFYYNLYIHYYEKMNGSWVRGTADPGGNNFPTADSITFAYRLENITPIGQNTALRGEIQVILEPFYFNVNSNHNDSLKYEFLLIDRSQNISNIIETPIILR